MAESHVCFVVSEILGLVRNGGIATATTHAALVLSHEGYKVDLFYCGYEENIEERWASRYDEAGVTVHWLNRDQEVHSPAHDSYRLYHQLKKQTFDVVVFQDWLGLGFSSVVAKRCGLAFDSTRLIHICHGPTDWLRVANRRLGIDAAELAQSFMEQKSASGADSLVSPSHHLVEWMEGNGWSLPQERAIVPYFTSDHAGLSGSETAASPASVPLTELVFFGRLEERKGVRIFADALNELGPELVAGLKVSFLGREETYSTLTATEMIEPRVRKALASLDFHTKFDQPEARAYLKVPGRVALIPSTMDNSPNVIYECLEDRIPFLASDAGGIKELIADEDRPRTLFQPGAKSMAATLRPLVESRLSPQPPQPSFDRDASLEAWRNLLEPLPPSKPEEHEPDILVSLVITHFNQPQLLMDAVRSAVDQDYPNLEIIVVDDGSDDPAAAVLLNLIETKDWGRSVKVIRQDNRYLGAARNAGVAASQGDLIGFLDDDDRLEPEYLTTMVKALTRTGADGVTSAMRRFMIEDGEEIEEAVWVPLGSLPAIGSVFNLLGGAAMLLRREVFDKLGGFHERKGVGYEDWDLLVRITLSGGEIVAVPEPLYNYRVRTGSMIRTTTMFQNMQPVFDSYRALLPDAIKAWPELLWGQEMALAHARAMVAGPDRRNLTPLGRDIRLMRYYFQKGGFGYLFERVASRVRRVTRRVFGPPEGT